MREISQVTQYISQDPRKNVISDKIKSVDEWQKAYEALGDLPKKGQILTTFDSTEECWLGEGEHGAFVAACVRSEVIGNGEGYFEPQWILNTNRLGLKIILTDESDILRIKQIIDLNTLEHIIEKIQVTGHSRSGKVVFGKVVWDNSDVVT